jgi:hypothetical protein
MPKTRMKNVWTGAESVTSSWLGSPLSWTALSETPPLPFV